MLFEVKNAMGELIIANKRRIYHRNYSVGYIAD